MSQPMTAESFDITAFAGETVRIDIIYTSINNFFFDVLIDNVRVMLMEYLLRKQILVVLSSLWVQLPIHLCLYESGSTTSSFDVTVNDTEAPVLVVLLTNIATSAAVLL